MKRKIIKIGRGQYLSDIEPYKSKGIPSNSLNNKGLPGLGVTELEMKRTKRNSVVIISSVPVIEDKVKRHNKECVKEEKVLGVHQGIDVGDIEDYLNSEATYKKIITTPEGFMSKVLVAFQNDLDKLFKDYFLLFDECERIITDVSYRGKIAAPIEWLLKFENKALVSATTLPFTHRELQAFDQYVIEPTYDYRKAINVTGTNNVLESLEAHLKTVDSKHLFLFVNSTEAIYDIVDVLGIKDQSAAYCADKSVAKLLSKKFKTGYSKLDTDDLAKYNFLTSRYFSALDIKLDYKPDVILVTDVWSAEHSVLDPQTEVIQIAGRFRNGINSLTHITNFKATLESKSRDESIQYLRGCFDTYDHIVDLFTKSKEQGSRETLDFFIKHSPVADYYIDNKLNDFMVDNYIYEQRVKGYYQRFENLKAAYGSLDKHFAPTYKLVEYLLGDEDRVNRNKKTTVRAQQWEAMRQIDILTLKMTIGSTTMRFTNSPTLLNNLRSLYPWLTEAYDLLGFDGLQKTGLSAAKINPAKAKAREIRDLKRLSNDLYNCFDEYSEPAEDDIKSFMTKLCSQDGITLRPSISLILKFFNGKRSTKKGKHIYAITNKIDLNELTPFD